MLVKIRLPSCTHNVQRVEMAIERVDTKNDPQSSAVFIRLWALMNVVGWRYIHGGGGPGAFTGYTPAGWGGPKHNSLRSGLKTYRGRPGR